MTKPTFAQIEHLFRLIDGGKITVENLQSFLEQPNKLIEPCKWEVWKTIKLGSGPKTADDFRRSLKEGGCRIGSWADNLLCQPAFKAASKEVEVDLVRVAVAELGFPKGANRQAIYDRAIELGLELCPAEVGPQLRLQYQDQPLGEWLVMGMEPITGSGGRLGLFSVELDDDGRWLVGGCGDPGGVWFSENTFLFVRPRK